MARSSIKTVKALWKELADGLGVDVPTASTYAKRIEDVLKAALPNVTVMFSPYMDNAWTILIYETVGATGMVYQYKTYPTIDELLDERHTTLIPRLKARLANKAA